MIVLLAILEEQAFKGHREQNIKLKAGRSFACVLQCGIGIASEKQRLSMLEGKVLFRSHMAKMWVAFPHSLVSWV